EVGQVVLAAEPYTRLSYRWVNYQRRHQEMFGWSDERYAQLITEPQSKVTFTLEAVGETVKLTVVHDDFVPDSQMCRAISQGRRAGLSALKTMLETDEVLSLSGGPT